MHDPIEATLGPSPDIRSWIYADIYLRQQQPSPRARWPLPIPSFWWREPGLWLPLSCAITPDAYNTGSNSNPGVGVNWPHTFGTLTNGFLWVAVTGDLSTNSDDLTTGGVTVGGIAMTQLQIMQAADRWIYNYGRAMGSVSAGSQTIQVNTSGNHFVAGLSASYGNVQQSPFTDANNTGSTRSGSSLGVALTPVAASCYVLMLGIKHFTGTDIAAVSNCTLQAKEPLLKNFGLFDSAGPVTAGVAYTETIGGENSANYDGMAFSLIPSGAGGARRWLLHH